MPYSATASTSIMTRDIAAADTENSSFAVTELLGGMGRNLDMKKDSPSREYAVIATIFVPQRKIIA